MNALRAESALDENINIEEKTPAGVAACGKQSAQPNQQKPPSKGKRKCSGRGGKKNSKQGKKPGKKSGGGTNQDKEETRTCYHCGEGGHLKPNCPHRDDSSGDGDVGSGSATSEQKR